MDLPCFVKFCVLPVSPQRSQLCPPPQQRGVCRRRFRRRTASTWVRASAAAGNDTARSLLILGGSGRVGQSITRALLARAEAEQVRLRICIAGRDARKGEQALRELRRYKPPEGSSSSSLDFVATDTGDHEQLADTMRRGYDLVLHVAGPFQQRKRAEVLEVALEVGLPYQDVCDDVTHMKLCRQMDESARQKNVPVAVCTGIYPGVSNLMALQAIDHLDSKQVDRVEFEYFTAGTGGAGSTILSTTFLLCAEPVTVFKGGRQDIRRPTSGSRRVDFGEGVGVHGTFLFNLPEVHSVAEGLAIANVSARFGTAPELWNVLTRFMAAVIPRRFLRDRELIRRFSQWIDPVVRRVDSLVGATTAMKVTATGRDGARATVLYAHDDLSICVGVAAAAFTWHLLYERDSQPGGVFYPEELFREQSDYEPILSHAVRGAFQWKTTVEPAG